MFWWWKRITITKMRSVFNETGLMSPWNHFMIHIMTFFQSHIVWKTPIWFPNWQEMCPGVSGLNEAFHCVRKTPKCGCMGVRDESHSCPVNGETHGYYAFSADWNMYTFIFVYILHVYDMYSDRNWWPALWEWKETLKKDQHQNGCQTKAGVDFVVYYDFVQRKSVDFFDWLGIMWKPMKTWNHSDIVVMITILHPSSFIICTCFPPYPSKIRTLWWTDIVMEKKIPPFSIAMLVPRRVPLWISQNHPNKSSAIFLFSPSVAQQIGKFLGIQAMNLAQLMGKTTSPKKEPVPR